MTGSSSNIQVLENFRPLLNILMTYHSRDYLSSNQRITHICQTAGFSLIWLGSWISILTNAWFCFDEQFDLNVTAQPISILISAIQMNFVYIATARKSARIDMIINRLQAIAQKREFYSYLFWLGGKYRTLDIVIF